MAYLTKFKPIIYALMILLPLSISLYIIQSRLSGLMGREVIVSECDLNESVCEIALGSDSTLTLSMNPAPAKSLVPLTFSFTADGFTPESAWIDLQGTTEYMGINQTPFEYNKGRWRATTELSVCTTGLMVWRARLTLNDPSGDSTPIDLHFEAQ